MKWAVVVAKDWVALEVQISVVKATVLALTTLVGMVSVPSHTTLHRKYFVVAVYNIQ